MTNDVKNDSTATESKSENISNEPISKVAAVAEPETQEQINWKKFRETREQERKQAEEAVKNAAKHEAEAQALKAAMDALLNKPAQASQSSEEMTEDQRIQHLVNQAMAEKERKNEEERKQREKAEFPKKLASNFSDFDKVCTTENLDYLEYHYPEVAKPLARLPDDFDKWSDIYKAVKKFVPNLDTKDKTARMDKNLAKPQSMSIPGKTQTGDTAPRSLDDSRRAANWARMQKTIKGG